MSSQQTRDERKKDERAAMSLRETPAPDPSDLEANVRWLRDRAQLEALYQRYAYGIDTRDFELVRSVFHPDCTVSGTLEDGALQPYLEGIEGALPQWHATMHFMGNQYVQIDGDRGHVETWVVGYHMEAPDSPLDHLVLGLRYQDDVVRVGNDWRIIRRNTVKQWHTGAFPRPSLGPPTYPRRS
jgi:hypothetical protein